MVFSVFSIVGVFGAALYVIAYGLLQLGIIRGSSLTYTILNLGAALAVLISLSEAFNLSSLIIQVFWIALSLIGIARYVMQQADTRFAEEESTLLRLHFPAVPPKLARRLLQLGTWREVQAGEVLTRHRTPTGAILYIHEGTARVSVEGTEVAQLGHGDLVGEITVIHDGPATADVVMDGPGRIFEVRRATLLKEMSANHDFALLMGQALQIEAQRKMELSNAAKLADAATAARATPPAEGRVTELS